MAIAKQTEHLARKMESRHIQMISLGGVIGTGLFLSSGYTIHQAGPLGTVLAYFVGALIVYSVMLCLGELSVNALYWFVSRVCQALYQSCNRLCRRHPLLADLDDCARF